MRLDLDLQPCTSEESRNSYSGEYRLVVWAIFAEVLDKDFGCLHVQGSGVKTNLIYLLPSLSACLL